MSRTLIGSSNIYKNYRVASFKNFKEYAMVRCVNLEGFVAQMAGLESTETEILISVVENIIDNAGRTSKEEDQRMGAIDSVIKEYVGQVEVAAKKFPGSRFVLVDPILRPKFSWYDDCIEKVKTHIKRTIRATGLSNVSTIDATPRASQQFEEDGVHLSQAAGKAFVGHILAVAEEIFKAPFVDLGNESDHEKSDETGTTGLELRVAKLENDTEERRWNDNMLFARTREELDTMANKAKEDRIILTGLTSSTPPPADWEQRKVWLRELVTATLKKIKPDFDGKIGYINQGKNNGKDIPMVEAKLASATTAIANRKAFADKRKENDGKKFGRLYVANSVSLSTRVRVDIMKAMAKKISDKTMTAHVAAYSSRPILHVRQVGKPESANRAYTFIDAVLNYGGSVNQSDLDEAYRRAGSAFRGQLEQHFVVLRENRPTPEAGSSGTSGTSGARGGGTKGTGSKGSKRSRESDETSESNSKKK